MSSRLEHDQFCDAEVPVTASWGVHTLRAVENYPIPCKTIGQPLSSWY